MTLSSLTIGEDRPIYAIGDIHGRRDTLAELSRRIAADFKTLDAPSAQIVILGDIIDRGPASAGCLDDVLAWRREPWCDVYFVLGNHEDAMLRFLEDPADGPRWIRHGGGATLKSYGVAFPAFQTDMETWDQSRLALQAAAPAAHIDLLNEMVLYVESERYVFVHAGLRPGVALADQDEHDLLFIRDEFFAAKEPFEKIVVHGHTPRPEPTIKSWRVNIDTGAYATGVLTALRLWKGEQKILQSA
jgi:serine/threonine protein phosphatase 1